MASFGCTLKDAVKNSDSINKMMELQKNNRNIMHEMSKNIKLSDLFMLKKLGEGQFGHVFLVTDKAKENCYALKCISKEETVKTKLEKHLVN